MNSRNILTNSALALYLIFILIYFFRSQFGIEGRLWMDITKTLPVLYLGAISLFLTTNRAVSAALILSAMGDLAGEEKLFLAQISLFAVAHICYIVAFVRYITPNHNRKIITALWYLFIALFGLFMVSYIGSTTLKVACSLYILLIGTMAAVTLNIESKHRVWYIVAALLFVFSDSCIAWNKFIARFDYAGLAIMTTYFAAQFIFANLALRERK